MSYNGGAMKQAPAFWIRLTKVTVPFLLLLTVISLGFVLVSTARAVLRQVTEVTYVTEIHRPPSIDKGQRQGVGDIRRKKFHTAKIWKNFRFHTRETALQLGVCGNFSKFHNVVPEDLWKKVRSVCNEIQYFTQWHSVVNNYSYQFVIPARDLCDKDTDTVVLIHSHHTHRDRRRAIRDTWGGAVQKNTWPNATVTNKVKVGFLFGIRPQGTRGLDLALTTEYNIHRDIIQGSFIESYRNLTLKSLLGLKWVVTYCPHVKYVIKCDDDMFINFPLLLDELVRQNMNRSILGNYHYSSNVLRTGKWKADVAGYPFPFFPPYVSGACYVISGDLVPQMYEASKYVRYLNLEDVYITGILAKVIDAKHIRMYGFLFDRRPHACDVIAGDEPIWIGTGMEAYHQIRLWRGIQTGITGSCSEAAVYQSLDREDRAWTVKIQKRWHQSQLKKALTG